MISCDDLNTLLNNDLYINNDYYINDEKIFIAISKDNSHYKRLYYDFPHMILSEIFYKSFVKNNKLDYLIVKYYYLIKDNDCRIVSEKEVQKYLDLDFNVYYELYECILQRITSLNTLESLKHKIDESKIISKSGKITKPSLLLHSCCGPCSSYVLDYLHDYFIITVLYFNPNIYPQEEYKKRVETQKQIIDDLGYDDIKLIVCEYNHYEYLDVIDDYKDLGEFSLRCYKCYKLRMELCAQLAKNKFDYFSTTLSISPYKNSDWINEIGLELEEKYNVKYIYSNFKLNDGYKKSIELSKKYHLYRQEYCGCEFSLQDFIKKKGQY